MCPPLQPGSFAGYCDETRCDGLYRKRYAVYPKKFHKSLIIKIFLSRGALCANPACTKFPTSPTPIRTLTKSQNGFRREGVMRTAASVASYKWDNCSQGSDRPWCLRALVQRIFADHIEQSLPPLFSDYLERARERAGKLFRFFHALGMGATRLRGQLEQR